MRILVVHNYYQHKGGEEQVFLAESNLLEAKGHQVWRYTLTNDDVSQMPAIALLGKTLWNQQVYQELRSLICKEHIQIAHFHNTFPLVSPAAYYACKAEGIPVVQTCHNYRLLCLNGMFLRDGQVCEDCLGKWIPSPGIQHNCYRGSRSASAGVATMLTVHQLVQTWKHQVDVYIALTEFARQKLIQGGIASEKVVVKPNFVHPDPGFGEGKGGYALFVGRLSQEKGIDLLLTAWERIGDKIPLKIVGDGPMAAQVMAAAECISGISWLGKKAIEDVYALMKEAAFLVFPSRWYEGLPRTIIESFAVGTPVIASNLGSMANLIISGETGLRFAAGNVEDLIKQILEGTSQTEIMSQMRLRVRDEFIKNYTAEANCQTLEDIYLRLLSHKAVKA